MYIGGNIIQDCFGNHYRLHIQGDAPVSLFLQAKQFSGAAFTERFVRDAQVSSVFWQRVLSRISARNFKHRASLESRISTLLIRGTLKLYPIKHLDEQERSASPAKTSVALPAVNGKDYTLAPASVLLVQPESRTQTFASQEQAVEFLTELKMDDAQRNDLATAMKIPAANQSPDTHIAAMAVALMENQFVIITSPPKITPRPKNSVENAPVESTADMPPSLGPHDEPGGIYARTSSVIAAGAAVAAAPLQDTDTPPLCQRNSLTVSCQHGQSVILGPDTKHMPSLDIIASSKAGKQADTITIKSDITDICPSHTSNHISIGGEMIQVNHTEPGKTSTITAYAESLNIRSNPIKYAWLPRIKPKTYPIYPGTTCDNSKLKDAGKGIQLNVYPKVAWDWEVAFGYGKDQHSLEENENSKGAYKKALSQKRFSIDGHIKLTQDNDTFELSSQFKQAVESSAQQIEAVTKLVDGVISRFDEGKEPKVTITWPNLKLKLKTELAEGKDHYRSVAFDFGVSAAPFFGLNVEVDILPVLAKPLDGGIISKWLIEKAQASIKKGMGNEDGLYFLKGEVSVIMKGSGTLACDAHFKGDFSNNSNRIEKVSGKPVEGKVEFSAEGKVDVKGHLLKVKVELVAGVGIKSGITLGMEIDSDDTGYYWQPQARFNGVKVYISKYVKVEEESGDGDEEFSMGQIVNPPNMTVKEIDEHVWIEEKPLTTNKHYFIEY